MTYPPQPGPAGQFPPEPVQPYQPPAVFVPDSPYVQPYGYPPPYAPPGYSPPYAAPGYPVTGPNDGLAIASLVVSCVGVLALCSWGIGAVLGLVGAILGHVARGRVRTSGAGGAGMALAGIITGWAVFGIGLIIVAVLVFAVVQAPSPPSS